MHCSRSGEAAKRTETGKPVALRIMRIGLALPHYDSSLPDRSPVRWPALLEAGLRAETLGFDSAWISDHFFADLSRYGGPAGAIGSIEPFTALAAIAARTERIGLGTLVACAPFRHPAHVAKMSTVIDLLSGGRFSLGIGAGWYQAEFESFGYEFGTPGSRFAFLEEAVQAVRALFQEGPVDLRTANVQLAGAFNHPLPARPAGPPIWVGGKGGDRQFRLVARHAAGWNSVWRWTPEGYAEQARRLREIAGKEGRDPASVRLSVGLYALAARTEPELRERFRALQRWAPGGALDEVTLEEFREGTLTGTVEQCLGRLEAFGRIGVEEAILSPASVPFAVFDWSMVEEIASDLIPAAHVL
jgi:probable F420-dependent oxidoreductase